MKTQRGFTLIELLVVIAIIGILASVILASLDSARAKAQDVKMKSELVSIQTALEMYYDQYGTFQVANAGWRNTGEGWLNYQDGDPSSYQIGVTPALTNAGFLGSMTLDPLPYPNYMIYLCNNNQQYSLSATLNNPSAADIAHIQTTCQGGSTYGVYHKNYAIGN